MATKPKEIALIRKDEKTAAPSWTTKHHLHEFCTVETELEGTSLSNNSQDQKANSPEAENGKKTSLTTSPASNLPPSDALIDNSIPSVEGIFPWSTIAAQDAKHDQKSKKELKAPVRKRRLQHVTTLADRSAIMFWMREQEALGAKNIPSKAVKAFPSAFRGTDNSNLMKASRFFRSRNEPQPDASAPGSGKRRKAAPGRGRKQTAWAASLHEDVREETLKLQTSGVRLTNAIIKTVACSFLISGSREVYSSDLVPKITTRWVHRFAKSSPSLTVTKTDAKSEKESGDKT